MSALWNEATCHARPESRDVRVDRPSSCRGDAKLYNIEQAAFAALRRARETARSTFTRDTNREGYFGGKKKFKKNPKKVLHLFFNLDTSASIERLNQGRNRKNTP